MSEVKKYLETKFNSVQQYSELRYSNAKVKFENKNYAPILNEKRLRYFYDEKIVGLQIEDATFNQEDWLQLMQTLQPELEKLKILYLNETLIESIELQNIPALEELSILNNKKLTHISLNNLPNLACYHSAQCPELMQITWQGKFSKLEKLDASHCALTTFNNTKAQFPILFFLNLKKNQLSELDIQKMPLLKYLFIRQNPITAIKWPRYLKEIVIVEIDQDLNLDAALLKDLSKTDAELNKAIESYLKTLHGGKEIKINRLKLIFIGNTNVGKTTLKNILEFREQAITESETEYANELNTLAQEKSDSTHGVNIFTKEIKTAAKTIFVQGFDFGGQDYYHSTHYALYGPKALNILVFGNCGQQGGMPLNAAELFGVTTRHDQLETVFPLNYWIGSLNQNEKINSAHTENSNGKNNSDSEPDEKKKETKNKWKLELVQNKRDHHHLEINNLSIRQNEQLEVGDIIELDFTKDALKIKKWLEKKIIKHAADTPILERDHDIGLALQKQTEMTASIQELINMKLCEENFNTEDDWKGYVNRLETHHFGLYCRRKADDFINTKDTEKKDEGEEFFILDLEKFSASIHTHILSKEMMSGENSTIEQGYFSKEVLKQTIKDKEVLQHLDRMLLFLERNDVIFNVDWNHDSLQVEDSIELSTKSTELQEWVAPSYLPPPQGMVANMLLSSFRKPDCVFTFKGFFHANIIQTIIAKNKRNLVVDVSVEHNNSESSANHTNKYVLWKNKVILYQEKMSDDGTARKNQKAFLLIELKYPVINKNTGYAIEEKGKEDEKWPKLCISRNDAGFVQDSIFADLFQDIYKELIQFKPEINIKTRFDHYIPYHVIQQETNTEKGIRSDLIMHNNVIYTNADFRHFRKSNQSEPTKIFIAYSRHDLDFVHELLVHLQPYENKGEVTVFYDKRLSVGEKWDEETKHQLTHADVVVCMVSPHMLGTTVVVDVEIPLAIEEGILIAPVLLRDCDWGYSKLDAYTNQLEDYNLYNKATALPANKHERDAHWKDFAIQLRKKQPRKKSDKLYKKSN